MAAGCKSRASISSSASTSLSEVHLHAASESRACTVPSARLKAPLGNGVACCAIEGFVATGDGDLNVGRPPIGVHEDHKVDRSEVPLYEGAPGVNGIGIPWKRFR
jgi:hypothetical protein